MSPNGEHIQQTPVNFTGTLLTGSINALEGNGHSRIDDLESLGYCLLFTVNFNDVPWYRETESGPVLQKIRDFIAKPTQNHRLEFQKIHQYIKEC